MGLYFAYKKTPGDCSRGVFIFNLNAWQCPTFTWDDPTLSSALSSFTSEFGMDSGGSYTLWPPDKPVVFYFVVRDRIYLADLGSHKFVHRDSVEVTKQNGQVKGCYSHPST